MCNNGRLIVLLFVCSFCALSFFNPPKLQASSNPVTSLQTGKSMGSFALSGPMVPYQTIWCLLRPANALSEEFAAINFAETTTLASILNTKVAAMLAKQMTVMGTTGPGFGILQTMLMKNIQYPVICPPLNAILKGYQDSNGNVSFYPLSWSNILSIASKLISNWAEMKATIFGMQQALVAVGKQSKNALSWLNLGVYLSMSVSILVFLQLIAILAAYWLVIATCIRIYRRVQEGNINFLSEMTNSFFKIILLFLFGYYQVVAGFVSMVFETFMFTIGLGQPSFYMLDYTLTGLVTSSIIAIFSVLSDSSFSQGNIISTIVSLMSHFFLIWITMQMIFKISLLLIKSAGALLIGSYLVPMTIYSFAFDWFKDAFKNLLSFMVNSCVLIAFALPIVHWALSCVHSLSIGLLGMSYMNISNGSSGLMNGLGGVNIITAIVSLYILNGMFSVVLDLAQYAANVVSQSINIQADKADVSAAIGQLGSRAGTMLGSAGRIG